MATHYRSAKTRRQEGIGYDSRYLRLQIQSLHFLPNEMPDLIRKELRRLFFEETAQNLRHEHDYKLFWRRDASMTRIDERRPPQHFINPADAHQFLNKEVMVYFEPMSVSDFYSRKIGCYIYREWLHLHNIRPIFQRDSFFAKAAHISNSNSGPQNLEQLSIFHHHLCEQLSTKMDQLVDFYPNRPSETSAPPLWGPMPSRKIQSWRDHGHIMRHLFRALYIVVDRQALAEDPPPRHLEHLKGIYYKEAETELDLSRCTVLLVKTGDEAHLHSPISFLPLFDAGLALPVNREDYRGDLEETAVRVKLNVAVRFVLKLLGREEAALENLRREAKVLRDEQERCCDAWLNNVMAHSDEVGIDNNRHTWLASRRALARMNNEAFEEDQVYPGWEILRRWTL
ncbi:uncharacterized protein NECHADRAFT_85289 [Fusarium vanettenii 77-13-4]|uniref:Uncharacterized protein n=1 Tax=Fusarium vanettenii (strain ATCC MYA-4622 / CBS 123669 / FGSC 9596 / NRRL 45880 / 77-13-4) TaxID=660122 RepID=C7ZIX5_FUSV7|nr:uncharacterized protein NECHADRAFT_85289 [Fusarium vanettenii 77-13-4]EEU35974.1 hypothetical protein NECHADRAFT_85289 [Fusarium vanettenii 77-13-4]